MIYSYALDYSGLSLGLRKLYFGCNDLLKRRSWHAALATLLLKGTCYLP